MTPPMVAVGPVPDDSVKSVAPHGEFARVRLLEAGQDFKERRFARSVRTDKARAFVIRKPERQIFKKRARTEAFGQIPAAEENRHPAILVETCPEAVL